MVKLLHNKTTLNKKGEPNGSPFCCGDVFKQINSQ